MCSVFGILCTDAMASRGQNTPAYFDYVETWDRAQGRGRDSYGLHFVTHKHRTISRVANAGVLMDRVFRLDTPYSCIGNRRGEPTTEWVKDKTDADVQPFTSPSGRWTFTHNGTIANDKAIYRAAGMISTLDVSTVEQREVVEHWIDAPTPIDSYAIGVLLDKYGFIDAVKTYLQGSFAILAIDRDRPDQIHYATNYKPLYWRAGRGGRDVQITSQREYLLHHFDRTVDPGIQEIPPYSYGLFSLQPGGKLIRHDDIGSLYKYGPRKVLVVCSGGLDSGTVAWKYHTEGAEICLWHLEYGAKAHGQELESIHKLAAAMNAKVAITDTNFFKQHAQSVLTDHTKEVNKSSGGADGAEFAHEWVPARNTVMMALALAYAEANGYNVIALGTNLEESGAYPDNEPEFLNKLNALVPYALKAYHELSIEAPCGDLMKREIVQLGVQLGMPHELTWSCYEGGDVHCGECGPCFMRREAFKMAGAEDPTTYRNQYVEDPHLGTVRTSM